MRPFAGEDAQQQQPLSKSPSPVFHPQLLFSSGPGHYTFLTIHHMHGPALAGDGQTRHLPTISVLNSPRSSHVALLAAKL